MQTINVTVNRPVREVAVSVNHGPNITPYQEALIAGFQGTREQWLASLKGAAFTFADFTEEQLNNLRIPGTPFTFADLTEEQKLELRGAPLLWQDLTPEMKAEIQGEDGLDFTFEDFTPEQLEAIIESIAAIAGVRSTGAKTTGLDPGNIHDRSITADFEYVCVQSGDAETAVWKKIALLES